ncbi:MAG TPA: MoaD/ThiS family protein [Gemmatimonadaceae bacterium]|jgi:molybdopterin converting factor small subunit|nr:MoaD/ThiS family protein [Gemmatimonadaceae bacterium]
MPITVNLPTLFAGVATAHLLNSNPRTVREAVEEIVAQFPQAKHKLRDLDGKPYPYVAYFLNTHNIRLIGGLDAELKDGDELTIISAVAGG